MLPERFFAPPDCIANGLLAARNVAKGEAVISYGGVLWEASQFDKHECAFDKHECAFDNSEVRASLSRRYNGSNDVQ